MSDEDQQLIEHEIKSSKQNLSFLIFKESSRSFNSAYTLIGLVCIFYDLICKTLK